jgi:hypothetical protein
MRRFKILFFGAYFEELHKIPEFNIRLLFFMQLELVKLEALA